jgi:predicted AAA+ superfamily ATPase
MERRSWSQLLPRVERLLELAEGWLAARTNGAAPVPDADAHAFRWRDGRLVPIRHPDLYPLDGLIGVERSVARLRANLESFVAGRPALDVLLYGERGTGKSSAVRGLLAEFGAAGLRLIEVRRDDLLGLPPIFAALRDRAERFVLFCDDLAFEEGNPAWRELKACLDGGLESRPANVIIIATSNRRHLIPERRWENLEASRGPQGELHPGETTEEKLSLSDRFGLLLPFFAFDQETWLRIVAHHARELGVDTRLPGDEIRRRALRFALERGTRSGRAARQACIAMLASEAVDGA